LNINNYGEIMTGIRIGDIERMHKLVDILGRAEGEKGERVQVWEDIGIFRDLFSEEKSSVEIIQEIRRQVKSFGKVQSWKG